LGSWELKGKEEERKWLKKHKLDLEKKKAWRKVLG